MCRVRVFLIGYPGLSVYIITWTQTLKVVVHMSHNYQSARAVWIFHRVVPSLVLRTVSVLRRFHRAFEAFDNLNRDLTQFVEQRIFPRGDQFLVPWSRSIEPWLTWPDIQRPWSVWVARVPSPSGYLDFSQIKLGLVFVGRVAHGLTLELAKLWDAEVSNAERVMRPSQSASD
jgi:hypothetical protein